MLEYLQKFALIKIFYTTKNHSWDVVLLFGHKVFAWDAVLLDMAILDNYRTNIKSRYCSEITCPRSGSFYASE